MRSKSKDKCLEISLLIEYIKIIEDFFVLDLNKIETAVILGYEWLSKLGETWIDWEKNTTYFFHCYNWVTIRGIHRRQQPVR